MRLRILDRYIFQEVVFAFMFAICAFTAVFIGSGTLFRIARYITDYGASFSSVVKIFVYGLPSIIMWTFPMSMLLATLLTFGRRAAACGNCALSCFGAEIYFAGRAVCGRRPFGGCRHSRNHNLLKKARHGDFNHRP